MYFAFSYSPTCNLPTVVPYGYFIKLNLIITYCLLELISNIIYNTFQRDVVISLSIVLLFEYFCHEKINLSSKYIASAIFATLNINLLRPNIRIMELYHSICYFASWKLKKHLISLNLKLLSFSFKVIFN